MNSLMNKVHLFFQITIGDKDNDGFYIVPNCMSSHIKPMLPPKNGGDSIGTVFEPNESIELPKGEYVLFKNVYFKRTLAKRGGAYTYTYHPLELLVKYSSIGKYLANNQMKIKMLFSLIISWSIVIR